MTEEELITKYCSGDDYTYFPHGIRFLEKVNDEDLYLMIEPRTFGKARLCLCKGFDLLDSW